MKTSPEGIALIQHFEHCELAAYPDPASPLGRKCTRLNLDLRDYRKVPNWKSLSGKPWTIDWGHTGPEVTPGLIHTQTQADDNLAKDLAVFEADVSRLVKVNITQRQFDALVSFAYNVGSDMDGDGIAEGLGDSTLLKKLNAGDIQGAANEFLKWNKCGGQVLRGLTKRRTAERALLLGQSVESALRAGDAVK